MAVSSLSSWLLSIWGNVDWCKGAVVGLGVFLRSFIWSQVSTGGVLLSASFLLMPELLLPSVSSSSLSISLSSLWAFLGVNWWDSVRVGAGGTILWWCGLEYHHLWYHPHWCGDLWGCCLLNLWCSCFIGFHCLRDRWVEGSEWGTAIYDFMVNCGKIVLFIFFMVRVMIVGCFH